MVKADREQRSSASVRPVRSRGRVRASRSGLSVVIGGESRPSTRPAPARATGDAALQLAPRHAPGAAARLPLRPLREEGTATSPRGRQHAPVAMPGGEARARWSRLGGAIVRHRALLPLPMVAWAALAVGSRGVASWAFGAAMVIAGLALRLAASAALARDRGRLATWGAYAWLRHPHDLGTAAAWIGLSAAAGAGAALPGIVVVLALLFGIASRTEERALGARFGDDWARWARRTPAWMPRKPVAMLTARGDRSAAWSTERAALAGFATLLVVVALGTFVR